MLLILSCLLAVSLACNAVLLVHRRKPPKRTESIELKEFLADLTGGKIGYVAVTRLNPDDWLLRSPKAR